MNRWVQLILDITSKKEKKIKKKIKKKNLSHYQKKLEKLIKLMIEMKKKGQIEYTLFLNYHFYSLFTQIFLCYFYKKKFYLIYVEK